MPSTGCCGSGALPTSRRSGRRRRMWASISSTRTISPGWRNFSPPDDGLIWTAARGRRTPNRMSLPSLFSLRGKRALITGSGQGIGHTLARGLGEAGAEIVLNDIDPTRLENAATMLRDEGLTAVGHVFDVTDE